MKKFFWLVLIIIVILPLMGASCISIKSDKDDEIPKNGGVFISYDKGEEWQQKVYVETLGEEDETIAEYNVMEMWLDPQDGKTVYAATEKHGVYVTYNGGEEWDLLYNTSRRVYELAVDPTSRNIIYISLGNKIVKSTDGGETWDEVYFEALGSVRIEAMAISNENPNLIYLGASDGRFIRSLNAGASWARIREFPQNIKQILINPNDNDIIYVATARNGVFRTGDKAETWHNISLGDDPQEKAELMKDYPGINIFTIMVFDQTQEDAIIIGTDYGLLKNKNGEASWEAVRLLTLPRKIDVVSLAVNPKNNQEIYYGINNALYFSEDGGKNWAARSLPTSRMTQYLLVSPVDTAKVYLGVYMPPPPEDDKKGLF